MFLIDIIPEQFHFIICKSDMPLLYFLDLFDGFFREVEGSGIVSIH